MYLLSWSSTARNDKALTEKASFLPTQQQRSPMTQIPLLNKMKRKRSDASPTSPHIERPVAKRKLEDMSCVGFPAPETHGIILPRQEDQLGRAPRIDQAKQCKVLPEMRWEPVDDDNRSQSPSTKKPISDNVENQDPNIGRLPKMLDTPVALREAIEVQFSLEILLKHRELRLIEQEFAKCQVALEQLRRCQICPYPALSSTFEGMQAASTGSGKAYDHQAPYAPPWGITNGPYTRHYDRWLIPDSSFDTSVADHTQTPVLSGEVVPERVMRGSKSEKGLNTGTSRSQRGSNGARLKSLPHGYPEPKEEKGPMIVKRSSDGKMVKLVCLDCRRSNFNSAQGFINHCRIAHSRQFLSHDAAIEASGEEIDMDTEGALGEASGSQASASAGLVHPLIRSALALTGNTTTSTRRKKTHPFVPPKDHLQTIHSSAQAMSTPCRIDSGMPEHLMSDHVPFNPSPQAPHLSALFARIGRGGDLNEMVAQATTKPEIDFSLSSDEDNEEDEEEMNLPEQPGASQSRSTRGVMRGGYYPIRTTKSPTPSERIPTHMGISKNPYTMDLLPNMDGHYGYQTPCQGREHTHNQYIPLHDHASPLNLSPNTVESHTAPSLVSDDGDYENTHSESETSSSGEADDHEDHYIHAKVIDHDEMDLGEGSSHDPHLSLGGKPQSPASRRRSSAMRPPGTIRDETGQPRHVSFASPVRRFKKGPTAKDGARAHN